MYVSADKVQTILTKADELNCDSSTSVYQLFKQMLSLNFNSTSMLGKSTFNLRFIYYL